MSVLDIIDFSRIGYALFFGILPIILLGVAILKPRGLYYMTVGFGIFAFLSLCMMDMTLLIAYIIVYAGFVLFWMIKGGMQYQRDGYSFDLYRELFESYYADDLNGDGINDAFDNWKIAHDPRFSWIFASRKVKKERRLRQEYGKLGEYVDFNPYFGDSASKFDQGGSYESRSEGARERRRTEEQARRRQSQNQYRSQNYSTRNMNRQEQMSEAERKVAAQHEFARNYNLRYFAMCASKSEGKKLYHKYAAKFHPDNPVTGDKEKFIKIDEEYNRFSEIPDAAFVTENLG